MSTYTATVRWKRGTDDAFAQGRYTRAQLAAIQHRA
jgi:hypothetical protein